jgi:hypothetical protein
MAMRAVQAPTLSDDTAARIFIAAQTLHRMPLAMARSIEVVGLDGPECLIAAAAARIADTFDLVAIIHQGNATCVRFER